MYHVYETYADLVYTNHVYTLEVDRTRSPEKLKWFIDGVRYFTVHEHEIGIETWGMQSIMDTSSF
jgi:hypothetical protein